MIQFIKDWVEDWGWFPVVIAIGVLILSIIRLVVIIMIGE